MNDETTFEESLTRLEDIVRQLDGGKMDIQTALVRYEEGVRLLKNCHTVLETAQRKIEILRGIEPSGEPLLETAPEEYFKTS